MRIHREGYALIMLALALVLFVNGIFYKWVNVPILQYLMALIGLAFFILVVQFFRNPKRSTPNDPKAIIAPADGKVVVIEEVYEPEFLKTNCRQISIFMSPLNVHVNRNPIGGTVVYDKYHPGKFLVAWHPKSSTENERTTVAINNGKDTILFRQIAGAVARRIRYYVKTGQQVQAGTEMGFIKFGSRVDIFIPLDAQVLVKLEDRPIGGETVIARLA
jgi:phosphatidylserine decarboxylase